MKKIMIAAPQAADDETLAALRARAPDFDVVAAPYHGKFAHLAPGATDELNDEERQAWGGAEIALALDLPPDIVELAPRLRWIQGIGAGVDHLEAANLPADLRITNAAGLAAGPIAEFVIGRLLEVWKHFRELDDSQRHRDWKPKLGTLVEGRTLGIIGLGGIGTAVATRACAFDMHVIGTRRSYEPGDTHRAVHELRGAGDLHAVLARCDAVVASAPGTGDTESMFNDAAFAAMKPGAVFCNVGRGSLVDEPALIEALERGHLGAAILDVTREEPMSPANPLWDAPNIYLSAHCSTSPDRYLDRVLDIFVENLERYTRGDPLRNLVELAHGY